MAEDDFDIFKFSNSSSSTKLQLGANYSSGARVPPVRGCKIANSSDSSDEEDMHGRRRSYRGGKKRLLAASRLLRKSDQDNSTSQDDSETPTSSKKLKLPQASGDSRTPSPSPPPPRLSMPSPPPPGVGITGDPSDNKSKQVLSQANDVLNRLWFGTPAALTDCPPDVIDLASFTPPVAQSMNLRVRYKGKVHKYTVNRRDPFSNVIALLAKELEVSSDDKILLSHKTATIKPTESPASLNLTTADFIDAVVMIESASASMEESLSADAITIKVQTSTKHKKYSLAAKDRLQKVMVAFAEELDTPLKNLKFYFDGTLVLEDQTPLDLDMENEDCIDVAL